MTICKQTQQWLDPLIEAIANNGELGLTALRCYKIERYQQQEAREQVEMAFVSALVAALEQQGVATHCHPEAIYELYHGNSRTISNEFERLESILKESLCYPDKHGLHLGYLLHFECQHEEEVQQLAACATKAATAGDPFAQLTLGFYYSHKMKADEEGVYAEAAFLWLTEAAKQGYLLAKQVLKNTINYLGQYSRFQKSWRQREGLANILTDNEARLELLFSLLQVLAKEQFSLDVQEKLSWMYLVQLYPNDEALQFDYQILGAYWLGCVLRAENVPGPNRRIFNELMTDTLRTSHHMPDLNGPVITLTTEQKKIVLLMLDIGLTLEGAKTWVGDKGVRFYLMLLLVQFNHAQLSLGTLNVMPRDILLHITSFLVQSMSDSINTFVATLYNKLFLEELSPTDAISKGYHYLLLQFFKNVNDVVKHRTLLHSRDRATAIISVGSWVAENSWISELKPQLDFMQQVQDELQLKCADDVESQEEISDTTSALRNSI